MNIEPMLQHQVLAALFECCSPDFITSVRATDIIDTVVGFASEDVNAFAEKDPASRGDAEIIARTYTSFKAVLHYRLAHALINTSLPQHTAAEANMQASILSNRGKLLSGAEIHHRCIIGRRFILDHGIGTVIGETAQIGDDCYVLGGVTLGATGISGNPFGKRHPTLGNRVQVGSFARIFGLIAIGDDVFIGPHCVIKDDVPANTVVTLKSEIQVVRRYSRPKKSGESRASAAAIALAQRESLSADQRGPFVGRGSSSGPLHPLDG